MPGFVYFIRSPSNGLIKIGWTAGDPNCRLDQFRVGSPVPLEPIGVVTGQPQLERELHRRFGPFRNHGEWFRPHPTLLAFLVEVVLPWPGRREARKGVDRYRFAERVPALGAGLPRHCDGCGDPFAEGDVAYVFLAEKTGGERVVGCRSCARCERHGKGEAIGSWWMPQLVAAP